MKRFLQSLVWVVILTLSSTAFAQHSGKAKKILDEAAQKIHNSSGVEVGFKMILHNAQGNMADSSSGTILLKDKEYKLTLLNTESYFDGETLWTYMVEDKEVNISKPEKDDDAMTPNNIFSMYKKGFSLNYLGEVEIAGKTYSNIDLYPLKDSTSYTKVNVKIEKHTHLFYSFHSYGRDGVDTLIQIEKMNLKKEIDDQAFVFNPATHQGVDIIDLR